MKANETRPATNGAASNGTELKNVVLNLANMPTAAEAEALAGREEAVKRTEGVFKTTMEAQTAHRVLVSNARHEMEKALYNRSRSRYAAGQAGADDIERLAEYEARNFAADIWKLAGTMLEAIESQATQKEANKEANETEKAESLSASLRHILAHLEAYNKTLEPYGIRLTADNVTPALIAPANISPLLLAPTADGAKVAEIARTKLHIITDWSAQKFCRILKWNKVVTDAAREAPRAAVLDFLKARAAAIAAAEEVTALENKLADRQTRLEQLKKTAAGKGKKAAEAEAQIDTAATELHNTALKLEKARRDSKTAEQLAEALKTAAQVNAGATPEALDTAAAAADTLATQRDEAGRLAKLADIAEEKARSAAAKEARTKKIAIAADAPITALAAFAPEEVKTATEARTIADTAAEAHKTAAAAFCDTIAAAVTTDPAQKYGDLLAQAVEAMKRAKQAKSKAKEAKNKANTAKDKRDQAAPIDSGATDTDFQKLDEEAKRAQLEADTAAQEAREATDAARDILAQLDSNTTAAEAQTAARKIA